MWYNYIYTPFLMWNGTLESERYFANMTVFKLLKLESELTCWWWDDHNSLVEGGGGGGEENINRFQPKKKVRAGLSNDVF